MVGIARGRGSATPARSSKRTSVRSTNKQQRRLLTAPGRSTKRTSGSSANKQESRISFISNRKAKTKHTVSSTICMKRQITTHDDLAMTMAETMLTGVPVPVGEQPEASTLVGPRGTVVDFSWRYLPPPFSMVKI